MANVVSILIQGKDQFSPKAQKAQRSAKGLQGGMAGLGKTALAAGAGFLVAQVGISAASKAISATVGAAIKFESAMTKINTLVGISKDVTGEWTSTLLEISGATARGPVELAEALFVVTSAGERGAEALEVVEAAAKASAVGLGETADISRAVTSAMQAFADQGLTAARATDILVSTVREGNLEASALASSLGRVLGPASSLGVTFEEVGAFIATYTRLGISAEEATTGLLSVMNTLIKPTDSAKAALADVGLSMAGLREQAAGPGGLNQVLTLLNDTFGGNVEELAKVIPNVRALSGVLGTAGAQGKAYLEISNNIAGSTGILDEAFEGVSQTTEFQLNKAMNTLNITMMELGADVLPVVIAGLDTLAGIVGVVASAYDVAATASRAQNEALLNLAGTSRDQLNAQAKLHGVFLDTVAAQEALRNITSEEAAAMKTATGEAKNFDAALLRLANSTGIDIELLRQTGLSAEEVAEEFIEMGGTIGLTSDEIQGEIGSMKRRALELAGAFEDEVAPKVVTSLKEIMQTSVDTRSTLSAMFREPTQDEADAELALANYRLELGLLEKASADAAEVEGSRAQELKTTVIPAAEDAVKLLRLERDATIAWAEAQDGSLPSQREWTQGIKDGTQAVELSDQVMQDFRTDALKPYGDELFEQQRILKDVRVLTDQQTTAMARAEEEYLKQVDIMPRLTGLTREQFFAIERSEAEWLKQNLAIAAGTGLSEEHSRKLGLLSDNLNSDLRPQIRGYTDDLNKIPSNIDTAISASIAFDVQQLLSRAASFVPAAHGFHGSVSSPTLFLAGEAGRTERVDITPQAQLLAASMPRSQMGPAGGGLTVNVRVDLEGSIFAGEDTIEDLADALEPHILDAIRHAMI